MEIKRTFKGFVGVVILKKEQARAHRIGQKEMVNVYFYVALGTIEEKIIKSLNKKRVNIDKIMGGEEGGGETVLSDVINQLI